MGGLSGKKATRKVYRMRVSRTTSEVAGDAEAESTDSGYKYFDQLQMLKKRFSDIDPEIIKGNPTPSHLQWLQPRHGSAHSHSPNSVD